MSQDKTQLEYELVRRCLQDDRQAHEALYNLHADKMFGVCMYYAKDRDQACDYLQEGYIKVFKKLHQFKFEGSLEGWIRRIIVNTTLSSIRKNKKVFDLFKTVENIPDMSAPVEVEMDKVPSKLIVKMVNQLPEKAALVLKLFSIEGYTHQEISEKLDITVGTSKSQLSRARQLLKISLKEAGF
ncbi:MAG: RNA polymerase sigma factor [Putridiphycobacter sp.]